MEDSAVPQHVVADAGPEPDACYTVRDEVAIEDFDDGSLVLLCEQLRLVELNPIARDVVGRLDGTCTVRQVAGAVAQAYGEPSDRVLSDLLNLLTDLEQEGVVNRCDHNGKEGASMDQTKRYLANPDVSCREEGPDGALLFNPDTNDLLVVNPTGLVIWQALSQPRTQEEIVVHLREACYDVPADQVAADVDEFLLQTLQPQGFAGEVTG
jgi:hypothetical protein